MHVVVLTQIASAHPELASSSVETLPMRAVWRSASTVSGTDCVQMASRRKTLKLAAGILDLPLEVGMPHPSVCVHCI